MRIKLAPNGKYALAEQMWLQYESSAETLALEEIRIWKKIMEGGRYEIIDHGSHTHSTTIGTSTVN